MATATIGNRSRKVSPEAKQRAERLAATAAAYAPAVEADRAERARMRVALDKPAEAPERTARVEGIDVEVRTFRRSEEFRSAPNARPMGKADIANVDFLDRAQIEQLTTELAEAAPSAFSEIRQKLAGDWAGLLNENEIWTLTAMAVRKYQRTGLLPR